MAETLRLIEDEPEFAVHPLANIFPMMSDDELEDLAADIKANGLLHPILRMIDGRTIVDGRNRRRACEIAGVSPVFADTVHDDAEARRLIVSANLQRRHLTKGQQAMALAMMYPKTQQGRRSASSVTEEVSSSR